MQYVIVKLVPHLIPDDEPVHATVSIVYGPFDEQGCSMAFRAIRRMEPNAHLVVRGLIPVGEQYLAEARHAEREEALTKALGIGPGETLRVEV
jgi:hypothetical protein